MGVGLQGALRAAWWRPLGAGAGTDHQEACIVRGPAVRGVGTGVGLVLVRHQPYLQVRRETCQFSRKELLYNMLSSISADHIFLHQILQYDVYHIHVHCFYAVFII